MDTPPKKRGRPPKANRLSTPQLETKKPEPLVLENAPVSELAPAPQPDKPAPPKDYNPNGPYAPRPGEDFSLEALRAEMPDLDNQRRWQVFVMAQNFELACSKDPETKAKALERLAKTSIVGLYETRVQVNINTLPAEELEKKLDTLINRINERTIEHKK